MSRSYKSSYRNNIRYIPKTISEINDHLRSMILWAPNFRRDYDPDRNSETEFYVLVESFGVVREKLGEERYAIMIGLTAQAKTLFADDLDDDNGKAREGRAILQKIEDMLGNIRAARKAKRLPDDEGEITGD